MFPVLSATVSQINFDLVDWGTALIGVALVFMAYMYVKRMIDPPDHTDLANDGLDDEGLDNVDASIKGYDKYGNK